MKHFLSAMAKILLSIPTIVTLLYIAGFDAPGFVRACIGVTSFMLASIYLATWDKS